MRRSSRVAQAYGYAVCLIAVVTILIGVGNLTDAFIERANPLMADGRYGSLTSFEAYRASEDTHRPMPARVNSGGAAAPDTATTAERRARYEALRADQLARVAFSTTQRLVKHALLVAIAAGLFIMHWRWLRSRDADADPNTDA